MQNKFIWGADLIIIPFCTWCCCSSCSDDALDLSAYSFLDYQYIHQTKLEETFSSKYMNQVLKKTACSSCRHYFKTPTHIVAPTYPNLFQLPINSLLNLFQYSHCGVGTKDKPANVSISKATATSIFFHRVSFQLFFCNKWILFFLFSLYLRMQEREKNQNSETYSNDDKSRSRL